MAASPDATTMVANKANAIAVASMLAPSDQVRFHGCLEGVHAEHGDQLTAYVVAHEPVPRASSSSVSDQSSFFRCAPNAIGSSGDSLLLALASVPRVCGTFWCFEHLQALEAMPS